MIEECKRLNDVFPQWLSGAGIFSVLQTFQVPWKSENISQSLDLEYHGNVSGYKIISPLIDKIIYGKELSESDKNLIATLIVAINNANWLKQWETLSLEYNPIENYSMVEIMSNDETEVNYGKTRTRTDNLTHGKNGNETTTYDLTDTNTPNLTTDISGELYGFNSANAVPTDGHKTVSTGNESNTRTGTETLQHNINETDTGTQTEADDGKDTTTRNYELKRSGNIGVTTSQQMLEKERQLRMWNFFREIVFPDIDRVLTIQIY